MKTYYRRDFIDYVYEKMERQYPWVAVYWIVKAVFESMVEVTANGDKIYADDCFTLEPKFMQERVVGNFGKPCVVSARYIPYFKPLKKMKDRYTQLLEKENTGNEEVEEDECTEE